MTAAASTNTVKAAKRINPPLHNGKRNIWEQRKIMMVMAVLHIFAAPAVILSGIISIYSGNPGNGMDIYVVIAIATTAVAGFLGIFPAVSSFPCLNNKSLVDMKLSLPMTSRQRFISNYLSGLFVYTVPFLAAQALSLLMMGYGFAFMEGRTFYRVEYFNGETITVPYVCEVFSFAFPALMKLILCGLLTMLMLYSVTVLITVCCGSKFESIAYTIIINAIIPLTEIAVSVSVFEQAYGIDAEKPLFKTVMYTCPAGGILAAADWVTMGDIAPVGTINHGVWALVFFLLTAAITALAYFLYGKRRAEQVSKPFVFKLAYYIITTCLTFIVVSLMLNGAGIIPTVIVTAIAYMIFEVVTNRGFKKFWLSIIKYAVTFAGACAVLIIGIRTDGFGAVRRVPSAASVSSVEIYYNGAYENYNLSAYTVSEYLKADGRENPILLKERENIETVTAAHRAIVDYYISRREFDGLNVDDNFTIDDIHSAATLNIKYNLKGGASFSRSYYSYGGEARSILNTLDLTEEYRTQTAEAYRKAILDIPRYYEEAIKSDEEHFHGIVGDRRAYVYNLMLSQDEKTRSEVNMGYLVKKGFYEQFAEAYYKDIMNINEENYYRSPYKNIWVVNTGNIMRSITLQVPESYKNSLEVLEYFFDMHRTEELSDGELRNILYRAASTTGVYLVKASGNERLLRNRGIYNFGSVYDNMNNCYVYDFDEDLLTLVRSAMPMNIVPENGYIIIIYGFRGVIPAELNALAEQVRTSGYNDELRNRYKEIAFEESNYQQ